MEGGADFRNWDELLPDVLGLIFKNLSLRERLIAVPMVCKEWDKVVRGPYCWQEIEIEEWSSQSRPCYIDRMIRMLIMRSCGGLRKLSVSELQDDHIFTFIADHAGSLQTLKLSRSNISDTIMEKFAGKFSTITFLDLSYCGKIGAPSLEAIGKHCKSLAVLRRNMHPVNTQAKQSQEDEAHAIAITMPKLKQLEIAYLLVDTGSILEVIFSCSELEFLDLRGCWNVKLDEKVLRDKFPKLKTLGPYVVDDYERNEWDGYSDYTDSFYDSDDDFEEMIWEDEDLLELSFYEGLGEDSGYGWPPSP